MTKPLVVLCLFVALGCGREPVNGLAPGGTVTPDPDGTLTPDPLPDATDTPFDAGDNDAVDGSSDSDGSTPVGVGFCAGICGQWFVSGQECRCDDNCLIRGDCCEGFCEDCADVEYCTTHPLDHGVNGAEILSHTIPESIECDSTFMANVVVKNTGTSTWTATKKIRLGTQIATNVFGDTVRYELPEGTEVNPGEEYAFEVPMNGPPSEYLENAVNVSFQSRWAMVHENIEWFGGEVVQMVAVTCDAVEPNPDHEGLSDPVNGPTNPGKADDIFDAALLFAETPIPPTMMCGQTLTVNMRALNMGDSTWTHEGGFGFGSWGNTNFVGKDLRVTVPEGEEIPPGENWMFSIEVVAPPASFINNFDSFNLPLFKLEWSMIQEDVNWFSNRLIRNIAITCPEDEEE